MRIKNITIKEVEYIAIKLAQAIMNFNEPIPDFSTRYPHRLESIIATPLQSFDGKYLYQGLFSKAAILLYLMIKNHPFQNGNKRIAITTLLTFLHLNDRWIAVNTDELYIFTMWIAQSHSADKDETVKAIEKFLARHIVISPASIGSTAKEE